MKQVYNHDNSQDGNGMSKMTLPMCSNFSHLFLLVWYRVCIEQILISFCQSKWSTHFCLIPYWSSELPITLRLKDGVYGEAGNNFSLRQSLFEHQTAPHFYDKIKSPAFLHIYYIQLLKLQIRVPKKTAVIWAWLSDLLFEANGTGSHLKSDFEGTTWDCCLLRRESALCENYLLP